ncbi:MobV family relaxase [Bacillus thermotolerans]|uniref:Mobilization protein BmpH n=1 Tax=Bacillus thermotolerans TaxID=1221996 RepID=A0A0F5HK76_BACTR|nr:MobV family relaxase [Bacillus thermotolerans]KKB33701.1 Mobilization protein BmpH [Bacillus thermotolerans]KKB35999.1 Mobilization protein BmpH [Bacillus thermotolerans]
MSYSIFRMQGIKTTSDLRGIGKHNAERISHTNFDIEKEKSVENIELVVCDSYLEKFREITAPMKEEHDEWMKKTRKDRQKTFEQAINSAKNDVACEFLFASDEEFFESKSKEEIKAWAEESLAFIEQDIGMKREHIIHAAVHMDEKTPHVHVVAVPLLKAYDGRRKAETWQISRKKFVNTKEDLIQLQDRYNQRMNDKGFHLERGVSTGKEHIELRRFKAVTAKEQAEQLEKEVQIKQEEKQTLSVSVQQMKSQLDDLGKSLGKIKKVDEVKIERGRLFGSKTVKLAVSDFEGIKTLAKASEGLRNKNRAFQREIQSLREQNQTLQQDNEQLKEENNKLKTERDWFKGNYERLDKLMKRMHAFYAERMPEELQTFELVKGFCKQQVNRSMNMFNVWRFKESEMNEQEKMGFAAAKEETKKAKKKRLQNELER